MILYIQRSELYFVEEEEDDEDKTVACQIVDQIYKVVNKIVSFSNYWQPCQK